MGNEAKITLGVDGVDTARRAAQDVETSWNRAGRSISSAWAGVGRALSGAVATAAQDIGRVALAADALNFSSAIRQAIDLQSSIERMALASGRNVGDVKRRFSEIGDKIGEQPSKVADWQRSLNRSLYDFDKTTKAVDLLGRTGFEVGRSLEELSGFGNVLGRSSKNADDLARSLGVVRAQAATLGKDKGAALFDSAGTIAGAAVGKFAPGAIKSKGGLVGEATAIQTALMEQGLPAEQAAEAAQTLITDVARSPREFERLFGMRRGSLTDKFGRLTKSPLDLLKMQQQAIGKMSRGNADYGRFIASNVLGPLAGGAATGLDFGRVEELANLEPTSALAERPIDKTPTAKSEYDVASRSRKAIEPLLPYVQQARAAMADHPIAGMLGFAGLSGAAGWAAKTMTARSLAAGASAAGGAAAGSAAAAGGELALSEAGDVSELSLEAIKRSKATKLAPRALGVLGRALELANPVADAYALAEFQWQGIQDIGEDTGTTGAKFRAAHSDILAESQVKGIARAAERASGDPSAFLRALSPELRADITRSPALQAVAAGAVNGEPVDVNVLSAALKAAISSTEIKVTLYNQTGELLDAVGEDKANASVRN